MSTPSTSVTLGYRLLDWQLAVKRDPHRFRVICAGRRSGKSMLGVDALTQHAATHPASLGWYVGPTYGSAKEIAWEMFLRTVEPFRAWYVEKTVESDMLIRWRNGSIIHLKGGDKPDSLRGPKLDCLVLDEYAIMRREVWDEVLQPATSDRKAPVLFLGTPKGYNHFYELYGMQAKNPADWRSFHVKTSEAGTISAGEIERARRDMDPRVFRQEYEAGFETFGGQVFTDFDRRVHVTAHEFPFNPNMEYGAGVDFGWSAPTVVLFINVDARENVYVFDELARRETPIPRIAELMRAVTKPGAVTDPRRRVPWPTPTLIACDPAGAAHNESLGTSSVVELRNVFGYDAVRYHRSYPGAIQDGVNQIRKWLRNKKLFVSPRCAQLVQALEMYRYPDPRGEVQSELPLKDGVSDHWIDPLRYFFLNRFPVTRSEWGALS